MRIASIASALTLAVTFGVGGGVALANAGQPRSVAGASGAAATAPTPGIVVYSRASKPTLLQHAGRTVKVFEYNLPTDFDTYFYYVNVTTNSSTISESPGYRCGFRWLSDRYDPQEVLGRAAPNGTGTLTLVGYGPHDPPNGEFGGAKLSCVVERDTRGFAVSAQLTAVPVAETRGGITRWVNPYPPGA